jgi:8-oxo-dGTP pyrophosphatase MutT (NUDIX family)
MKISTLDIEIHDKVPHTFSPQVQVAACYLEIDGKILLLQRASNKSEPGRWGVPAGKLEKNETPETAAKRELFEETGIDLDAVPSQIEYLSALFIRKPGYDFIYHSFKVQMGNTLPDVHISDEHQDYKWATNKDLQNMPLMSGAWEAIQRYRSAPPKKRAGSSVSTYLILQQNNQILLGLRKNTGYNDGLWSLVAGHVEDGEPATTAMIREAKEEIGIELTPADIRVVHIMHRKSNRLNVDIFFVCSSWAGTIQNCEPEKCEKLEFFPIDALPINIVNYNADVLQSLAKGEFYSEQGWDLQLS